MVIVDFHVHINESKSANINGIPVKMDRKEILKAMEKAGVKDYDVEFDPANKALIVANMQPVTVTVSVKYSDVAWLSPDFFDGAAITASCTMPADLEEERD